MYTQKKTYMAKIEEPMAGILHSSHKKRTWGGTMLPPAPTITADHPDGRKASSSPTPMDMRAVLERYRSLALVHRDHAKRRRLESARRSARNSRRLEQIFELRRLAGETLAFCSKVLRDEEKARREDEGEGREADADVSRAGREMALAEEFLGRFGWGGGHPGGDYLGGNVGLGEGGCPLLGGAAELKGRGTMDDDSEDIDDDEDDEEDDRLIGGIPSKFLDLSHFPHLLRKSFRGDGPGGGQHRHRDAFVSPEDELGEPGREGGGSGNNGKRRRTIIDCTEDDANDASAPPRHFSPARVPSFGCVGGGGGGGGGVPRELAVPDDPFRLSSAMPRDDAKRDAMRACVSNASLSHVNGTYIRGGTFNGAPLFVRAGGPRKFMGRDCAVVLRRERVDGDQPPAMAGAEQRQRRPGGGGGAMGGDGDGRAGPGGDAAGRHAWKIGLVPANCVGHPRIICYFLAREEDRQCASSSSGPRGGGGDRMDEDDLDEEEEETYFDPPADGWRVFQETRAAGKVSTFVSGARTSNLGRASCLRISYE